jgi:hypothetical protein
MLFKLVVILLLLIQTTMCAGVPQQRHQRDSIKEMNQADEMMAKMFV